MAIRIVRCEHCGYIFVPPYPDDYFCLNCERFSANLFDAINRNKRRKVESKDFEIKPIRNIEGTERRKKSKIPKKIIFYGIVSKERIPLYYNNAKYKYILELTSNLDFIATSTLSGTLDKMLIYLENEDEGDEKQIIARFFEKNGIIHILIGNFSDKDSDWIFNQVSRFLNDLLRKNNIDIRKELSNLENNKISINMDKFLNHIEEEYELKVEFKNPNFDYIDDWLRLDYFGLSLESVGVISLLLDKENNLKFNEQQQFESSSEKLDFRESVLTAKIEAISAIIRGNMKGYPRWISIKAGFQKYRYLSFKKLENQFFYYCITERKY
ncbi:MAG: hypothetical protein MUP85_01555 [Candidatus Lokiarchaeota archaeon]|nr:hypothetical protein [Candidatus Lokiarchaeota archaeon]